MARTPRERLAKLLDDAESPGAFSAQLLVPADSLHLEVEGAGQIRLPVRAPQARKLCDVGRPARFGRGEQTLTDPSVRDTWEIHPDLVTITGPGWAAALEGVLDEVRDQLGLPLSSRLEGELHAMLVYGPGQFFLPHQDSEKDDAMIGTLVVTLPSSHTGGELIVEHGGESVAYRSPRDSLSFVAFYADCRHQVKPVRSGYRVTLTFNLLARSDRTGPAADRPVAELTRCLTGHFTTRASKRYVTGVVGAERAARPHPRRRPDRRACGGGVPRAVLGQHREGEATTSGARARRRHQPGRALGGRPAAPSVQDRVTCTRARDRRGRPRRPLRRTMDQHRPRRLAGVQATVGIPG